MRSFAVAGVLALVAVGSVHGTCPNVVTDIAVLETALVGGTGTTCALWDGRGGVDGWQSIEGTLALTGTAFTLTCATGSDLLELGSDDPFELIGNSAQLTVNNCGFHGVAHFKGNTGTSPRLLFNGVWVVGSLVVDEIDLEFADGLAAGQVRIQLGGVVSGDTLAIRRDLLLLSLRNAPALAIYESTIDVDALDVEGGPSANWVGCVEADSGDSILRAKTMDLVDCHGTGIGGMAFGGGSEATVGRLSVRDGSGKVGGVRVQYADLTVEEAIFQNNTGVTAALQLAAAPSNVLNISTLTTTRNVGDESIVEFTYPTFPLQLSTWTSTCDRASSVLAYVGLLTCEPGPVTVANLTVHVDDSAPSAVSPIVAAACSFPDDDKVTVYTSSYTSMGGYTVRPPTGVCPGACPADGYGLTAAGVGIAQVGLAGNRYDASGTGLLSVAHVPAPVAGGSMWQPRTLPVPAGTAVTFDCCGAEACDVVVAVYACPSCPWALRNGNLPEALLSGAEPWTPVSCAPHFSRPETGAPVHPTVALRKRVDAGDSTTFTLAGDASALFVFAAPSAPSTLEWCPPRPHGPSPPSSCASSCFAPP